MNIKHRLIFQDYKLFSLLEIHLFISNPNCTLTHLITQEKLMFRSAVWTPSCTFSHLAPQKKKEKKTCRCKPSKITNLRNSNSENSLCHTASDLKLLAGGTCYWMCPKLNYNNFNDTLTVLFSTARNCASWPGPWITTLTPLRPALPVLPERWMYMSRSWRDTKINPLIPKIWMLILRSRCFTFSCKSVTGIWR